MPVQDSSVWCILACIAFSLEIITATFYLLVIIPGLITGALLAYLKLNLVIQIFVASLINIFGLIILQINKKILKAENINNLDINNKIYIDNWQDDGSTIASYRGSYWPVISKENNDKIHGTYKIIDIKNNTLIVKKNS